MIVKAYSPFKTFSMRFFLRSSRHVFTALHDTVMAELSFLLALYLRLGDNLYAHVGNYVVFATSLCGCICLIIFYFMQLYRGLWRYSSVPDLIAIVKSVTIAILLFYLILFIFNRLQGMPRFVPFVHWMLLIGMLGAPRFIYRIWRDRKLGLTLDFKATGRIPVILIGLNDRAELFLRDTFSGSSREYFVACIIDEKGTRTGSTIHNVDIYGSIEEMPMIVERLADKGIKPQRTILAMDMQDGAKLRRLLEITHRLGLPLARLPRMIEFKQGTAKKLEITPIAVEDLLQRAQNVHDNQALREHIAGKVVLVTGAGGTIGSELVRQIAALDPLTLLLYELSEYALYQIDMELGNAFASVSRHAIIGDIRDVPHLNAVFEQYKPHIVFHAAAIKHVPLAESNAEEAMLTNIFGTRNVARSCIAHHVNIMVMISTDKAVNPTNVMGASKRAAESYCQALGSQSTITRFVAVRFGNVLGSTGSVVPLFQKQLASGGPITVTHPEMVRYFMTVREAVELVLYSFTLKTQGGEVCVLDMGQPVKILDLAEQMIRLAGLKPHQDIKIEFTGLRPGEKMFEELFHSTEAHEKTAHDSIWLVSPRYLLLDQMEIVLRKLHTACETRQKEKALLLLKELVPEYHSLALS